MCIYKNPIAHMIYVDNSFFRTDIEESDVISVFMNSKDSRAGFNNILTNTAKNTNSYVMPLT